MSCLFRAISLYWFALSFRNFRAQLIQEWRHEARTICNEKASSLQQAYRNVEMTGYLASTLIKYQCARKRKEIDRESSGFQRKLSNSTDSTTSDSTRKSSISNSRSEEAVDDSKAESKPSPPQSLEKKLSQLGTRMRSLSAVDQESQPPQPLKATGASKSPEAADKRKSTRS